MMLRALHVVVVLILFAGSPAFAQSAGRLHGTWTGVLALEIPFRVVVHVRAEGPELSGSVDFPDQNARGLPLTEIRAAGESLLFRFAPASIAFEGRVSADADSIYGTFAQGEQRFPLVLRRMTAADAAALERPQEPKAPFPYREEQVRVAGAAPGVVLAGTLTVPAGAGPHRAVLLLPGAGPLDRDASVAGHRPFRVLADHLARRGFVVLRLNKRGVAPSSGSFADATTADAVLDAEAVLRYLRTRREVRSGGVALIGHSEGALVAAGVAGRRVGVGATVLIGAPGMRGETLMVERAAALFAARGVPDSAVRKDGALRRAIFRELMVAGDKAGARTRVRTAVAREIGRMTAADRAALGYGAAEWKTGAEVFLDQLPWFRHWLVLDPLPLYRGMRGPVLALYGGTDQQVPPAGNSERVRGALGTRRAASSVVVLPRINHQMQESATGSSAEYGRISQTISPAVLDRVVGWLNTQLPD